MFECYCCLKYLLLFYHQHRSFCNVCHNINDTCFKLCSSVSHARINLILWNVLFGYLLTNLKEKVTFWLASIFCDVPGFFSFLSKLSLNVLYWNFFTKQFDKKKKQLGMWYVFVDNLEINYLMNVIIMIYVKRIHYKS